MARRLIGNLAIAVGAFAGAASDGASRQTPAPVVELGQVENFRGKVVTVCGRVATYQCDSAQRQTRLDFEKPYWANPPGVVMDGAARSAFGPRVEDKYVQAELCATGIVERIKGRDLVRVETPDQIVVRKEPPGGSFGSAAVRSCDANVAMPKVTNEVKPFYTAEAMHARVRGTVFLDALVMRDGSVGPVQVLAGLDPDFGLNDSAVKAVQQWRFQPGTFDGKPVPVIVSIELQFTLK